MEHSRVKKFKEYRDSFTKAEAEDIGEVYDIITGLSKETRKAVTGTLPMDQVIHSLEEDEAKLKEQKQEKMKKILFLSIAIFVGLVIISGLVILGIVAFGG